MALWNRLTLPLLAAAFLLAPSTLADYSILGGMVIVHTNGDPGTTVTPAASDARVAPHGCYPAADYPVCPFVRGNLTGQAYAGFVFLSAPGSCPGGAPDCVVVAALLTGYERGGFAVVVGAQGCGTTPSNCAWVYHFSGTGLIFAGLYQDDDAVAICARAPDLTCQAVTATSTVTGTETYACLGAGATAHWEDVPGVTCEGLRYEDDPLCVELYSNGFDVICETRAMEATEALP